MVALKDTEPEMSNRPFTLSLHEKSASLSYNQRDQEEDSKADMEISRYQSRCSFTVETMRGVFHDLLNF